MGIAATILDGGLGDDSLFGGQQDDLLYGQLLLTELMETAATIPEKTELTPLVISKGDDWVMDFNMLKSKMETADLFSHHPICVISNLVLSDSDGDFPIYC